MMTFKIVLPCAKGSEQVLQAEIESLGLSDSSIKPAVVTCFGNLEDLYRICLWSRVASRVLLVLTEGDIESPDDLYDLAKQIPWDDHLSPQNTFSVRFTGSGQGIRNTQFGALRVKDAMVDHLRELYKSRPNVDSQQPDISIDVHLHRGHVTISLDFSGGSLHERGYRQAQGVAPIKETLAATMLYRAQFHLHKDWQSVIDPMCGAGTILCEAALMAADIAPGLLRHRWGFLSWQSHKPAIWRKIKDDASQRRENGLNDLSCRFFGYDADAAMIKAARENVLRLGLSGHITLDLCDIQQFKYQQTYQDKGLIISNPPYGERIGKPIALVSLYAQIGNVFKSFPDDWMMTLIASDSALIQRLKLRVDKQYQAFNGPLEVRILTYLRNHQAESDVYSADPLPLFNEQAQMFANRLQKNIKKYLPQANKCHTNAYRLYDQDMPEYAVAIDRYDSHVVIQEYAPPKTVDSDKAQKRLYDILQVTGEILEVDADHIVLKTRRRQQGAAQYMSIDKQQQYLVVTEGAAQFYVNLHDYLDTGLFLDHRAMRRRLFNESKDKRVLNLFCYTATASVHAALGGAAYTTSIDLSQTYLDWAQKNFQLNNLSSRHRLQKADVMDWLESGDSQFDLIFCDPPTFSNTKKKERVFDIQQDHEVLIKRCMKRLVSRGTLYFSNNYRGFKLSDQLLEDFVVEEITKSTLDFDFVRRPKIHRVWKIAHRE